jgi:hypothetical protein
MVDAYRQPSAPDPEDLEEEEKEEEEEEMPEPPNFPTFWIALILFCIEGTLYFFKPEQGMIVLSVAFNVILYALFRIKIAYSQSQEYEERMKKLQEEAKQRKVNSELAETKYTRAAATVVCKVAAKDRVPVETLLKEHTGLADDDLSPAATHMRTVRFG